MTFQFDIKDMHGAPMLILAVVICEEDSNLCSTGDSIASVALVADFSGSGGDDGCGGGTDGDGSWGWH